MRRPRLSAVLALALGTAYAVGPAGAQVQYVELPDGAILAPWNMTVDAVEDLDVLGANGQKIGEVEEVIGTDPATPAALVVDFEGGSGFDTRDDIAVPLDAFSMAPKGLLMTLSADSVAALPTWDD
ncbi:hypothetical protein GCM10011390_07400 [Aureimonas endophytica]|uniref:PRC-barrel domain-containing protein n=1 Tax=Aureimonas endophytica TaxID=2027858 RepID=A0A916ZDW0_9HYPH|nr:PRC-barrel domain-containing protein [Aureimonas endophytica]GGD91190.1 hypothetical protein GCM10011390_07400 [Aureimonas endophytica]